MCHYNSINRAVALYSLLSDCVLSSSQSKRRKQQCKHCLIKDFVADDSENNYSTAAQNNNHVTDKGKIYQGVRKGVGGVKIPSSRHGYGHGQGSSCKILADVENFKKASAKNPKNIYLCLYV